MKVVAFLSRPPGILLLKDLMDNPEISLEAVYTHKYQPSPNKNLVREDYAAYADICRYNSIPFVPIDTIKNVKNPIIPRNIDVIVSLSWRGVFPEGILKIPKLGTINIHRGKLPEFKGAEPVKRAIISDFNYVEITAHEMIEEVDSGFVLSTIRFPIEFKFHEGNIIDEYTQEIRDRILPLYVPLFRASLEALKLKKGYYG